MAGCRWKGRQLGTTELRECTIVTAVDKIYGRVIVSLARPKARDCECHWIAI